MIKKYLLSTISIWFLITNSNAQEATYYLPKAIRTDHTILTFEKVKSTSSKYFINYKAENLGDGVLVIDRSKVSLVQDGGEMRPLSKEYVLKPGEEKTIYNDFRIKAPIKANADQLDLTLYGIRYAMGNGKSLEGDKLVLKSGATQTIGDFSIKLMEYNVYSDRVFAEIKCTYNGGQKRLGKIDLKKITIEGGKAEIVKKGDVVFNGKSYTFAVNITPEDSKFTVDWTGVFQVLNLVDVNIKPIKIKSAAFKEKEKKKEKEKSQDTPKKEKGTATKPKSEKEPCALSYNEFTELKNDLKKEVDSGGKPIPMANEYLLVKGCLNTAQVVELMGQFNLDSPRLEFAKMAYQFTSDKHKYHLAVGKLAYNKNKEALEDFLGQQK
ncbi:DUF4476 domain-containing protein [Aquimarina sp. 2201CG1-2-11]|uniref:DUF4476 domain-containing protein n=1 Tax=Aquimarina discodermiae TaxID=3231043 RepID=UPI0034632A86